MKCLHCLVEFRDEAKYIPIDADEDQMWIIESRLCPACGRLNLMLVNSEGESFEHLPINIKSKVPIRPKGHVRTPCPPQVPAEIAGDYHEACLILADSPRASAAISRSAIQKTLRDKAGVPKGNLITEILELVGRDQLPESLALLLAAVLKVGNFAVYPMKGSHPTIITAVAKTEASLNLDVLEGLFEYYYVQPEVNARRFKALGSGSKFSNPR